MAIFLLPVLMLLAFVFSLSANPASAFLANFLSPAIPAARAFLILSTSYGLGQLLFRALRLPTVPGCAVFIRLWIGMQLCVYSLFLFSLSGCLTSMAFPMLLIGINFWLFWDDFRNWNPVQTFSKTLTRGESALASLVLGASVLLLLSANTPISWYDSLVYHMALPQYFLEHGRIAGSVPGNVYSHFPLNAEILNLCALLLKSEESAKFLAAFQVLLSAGFCFSFVRAETQNRALALFSSLFVLTLFLLYRQVAQNDVDAFVTFGVCVFWGHLVRSPFNHWKEFLISGLLAGTLLGFKYSTGPLFVLPGAVFLLVKHGKASGLFIFFAAALLISLPWWIRNALSSGNPFFPFFSRWIASKDWSTEQALVFERVHGAFRNSLRGSAWGLLSELDGGLLLAALFLLRDAIRKHWMILGLLPFVFWGLLSQGNIRFILPLYPFLLACAFVAIHEQYPRFRKLFISVLCVWGLLRLGILLLLVHGDLPFALGVKPHSEKLDTLQDPYFRMMQDLNDQLPRTAWVLMIGEARTYGARFRHASATVFDRNPLEKLLNDSNTLEEVLSGLKRQGFTHALVNRAELERLGRFYGSFFPSIPGYYFQTDSKEARLFSEFIAWLFQKNEFICCDAAWVGFRAL